MGQKPPLAAGGSGGLTPAAKGRKVRAGRDPFPPLPAWSRFAIRSWRSRPMRPPPKCARSTSEWQV